MLAVLLCSLYAFYYVRHRTYLSAFKVYTCLSTLLHFDGLQLADEAYTGIASHAEGIKMQQLGRLPGTFRLMVSIPMKM